MAAFTAVPRLRAHCAQMRATTSLKLARQHGADGNFRAAMATLGSAAIYSWRYPQWWGGGGGGGGGPCRVIVQSMVPRALLSVLRAPRRGAKLGFVGQSPKSLRIIQQLDIGTARRHLSAVELEDHIARSHRAQPVGDQDDGIATAESQEVAMSSCSDRPSCALVASSMMRTDASVYRARAMPILWRCPPLSFMPRSPTTCW